MPISTIPFSARKAGPYTATAGQTSFPFAFPVLAAADLAVWRERDGVAAQLTIDTDYAVTGAGEQAGGAVVLTSGAEEDDIIAIDGTLQQQRVTSFTGGNPFKAAFIDADFNRLAIMVQELARDMGRAIRRSPVDERAGALLLPTDAAQTLVLAVDTAGKVIGVVPADLGATPVTPAAMTVLDDVTIEEMRATLEVGNVVYSSSFGLTAGDQSSVVQQIFDAAPDGGTVIFEPVAGIIEVGSIVVADKSLTVDFGAGNRWRPVADDEQMFLFNGSYSNEKAVTSLSTATDATETGSGPNAATVLLMSDTSGFTLGDVVKVYADDLIPDKHTASADRIVGEHAVIHAITANTSITLKHQLFDHSTFSTNIKVSLFPRTTLKGRNLRVYGDPAETAGFFGLVECRTLREPCLTNIEANSLRSAFLRMADCYRYSVQDVTGNAHGSGEQSGSTDLPYLVEDLASREGKVQRVWANHVRHLFTTNTNGSAYATPAVRSGRTLRAQVIDCIGSNSLLQPFDTHPEAAHVSFVNCAAINCGIGFQSRSRHTRFINPIVRGCPIGFNFSGAANSDTNSIDDQLIIDADAESTDRLIAVSSGSTVPETLGAINAIGGRFKVSPPDDDGCVFNGQRRVDVTMSGAHVIVDAAAASLNSLFRLQERGSCRVSGLTIDFTDSAAVDPALVFYGGTVATPGVVTATDIDILGASKVRYIAQNGDLYHDGVRIVDAHASFEPQTGDGEEEPWEVNARPGAWQVLAASAVAVPHTGTTAETTLVTIPVPANAMGANGLLRVTTLWSLTNAATNNLIGRVKLGGTTLGSRTMNTTGSASARQMTIISNRNSASSQVAEAAADGASMGEAAGVVVTGAVNTAAAQNLTITAQMASAADTMTLESYLVELCRQA